MRNAIVVGGSNGIGLSIAAQLKGYRKVYIIDKKPFPENEIKPFLFEEGEKTFFEYIPFDLLLDDYSLFDKFSNIDTLIITAGVGRLALFESTEETEIERSFRVNTIAPIRIVHHMYDKIKSKTADFYCAVLVSISGHISSPFFSIYGSTKAALHRFIESVNVELEKSESSNRILEVSPGSLKGTNFYGGENDLSKTLPLAKQILQRMYNKECLYIPQYEEIFRDVIKRYQSNPHMFGLESYAYKLKDQR